MPLEQQLLSRLDDAPLTRLHIGALAICAAAFAFDLMEIGLGGALAAVFSAPPYQLGASELSWLLSGAYIGAILGASTMGGLAERCGRRRVLTWLLLALAVTSALAAASRTPLELTVARALSGITLGAFPPLMVVLLTDLLPARRRGVGLLVVCGIAYLGAPAGIFLVRQLSPLQPLGLEAWRWVFWLGTAGSAGLALAMHWWVPESARWLISRGRLEEASTVVSRFEASKPVFRPLPAQPSFGGTSMDSETGSPRRFTLLASLYFLAAWSTVAFPLLSGAVMMEKGVQLNDTLLYVGVATFGPFLGSLASSRFADTLERRTSLSVCAVLMLCALVAFMVSDSGLMLAFTGLLMTLVASIYVPMLNLYGAEVAKGGRRGAIVTGAWTFNRIGAALSPLLLLPLMKAAGVEAMFWVIGLSLCLSLLLLTRAPRGQANRPVD